MGYLKRLKISAQLSMLAIIVIILILVLIYTHYIKVAQVIEENNKQYFTEMISQINQVIASNSDTVKRLLENISYNSPIVQEFLNETDPLEKYSGYTNLKSYITDMVKMKDGILDIAIIGNEGTHEATQFNIYGDINNIVHIAEDIPPERTFFYTEIKTINWNNKPKEVFIAGAQIYSITNFEMVGQEIGTLMIVLDVNALLGRQDQVIRASGSSIYMTDRNDTLFYSNDSTAEIGSHYVVNANTDKDSEYVIQTGFIPDIDGKITIKMPQSELLSGLDEVRKQQYVIAFLALLLLVIPFTFVINNIVQPLKKLMRVMNQIKFGDWKNLKGQIEVDGYWEIIMMTTHFNQMLNEIDDLTQKLITSNAKLYEAELVKKQSELAYLQSQINPHFLYNTFESMKGLAVEAGSDDIFRMVKSLGEVFRYSIKEVDLVLMREELSIVKDYIHIQKVRFRHRLTVEYEFDEALLTCKVPKMILQPIVENAIFHGIEPKVEGSILKLSGHMTEQVLHIIVSDSGVGIEEEKLQQIQHILSTDTVGSQRMNREGNSIGLVNVHNRIRLKYGEQYGLQVRSVSGIGTKVVIKIPCGGE